MPRLKRLAYRAYRHPLTLLGIGPIYIFVVKFRLPLDMMSGRFRHHRGPVLASVMLTNLAIATLVVGLSLWLGFAEMLVLQVPIIVLSSAAGVWLFYVQHQFEDAYWEHGKDWNFREAAVAGSSFYDLPRPLGWLTADIGIHHVHHLSSRIPNYRLRECLEHLPDLPNVTRLTFLDSFKCLRLALYDEDSGRMVRFGALRGLTSPA